MKKDWKYILYIAVAVALFVVVKLMAPKQFDWTVTLAHDDKDPYGTYCLNTLLPGITSSVKHNYKTLYEMKDSLGSNTDILILATKFAPGEPDVDALLKHINGGGRAFISAHSFASSLSDTLKFEVMDNIFRDRNVFNRNDSTALAFVNPLLDGGKQFWFRSDNVHNYFTRFDSTRCTVVARNDSGDAVSIKMQWGKGYLILNTTPLVFTNIYALSSHNHEFIAGCLSYLGDNLYWTEFYQLGRQEIKTPLRFILSTEPLRLAYYVTIISILIFMLFEIKRRQRIIPVITPPKNTTLEFIRTIGNLYYQTSDHKNVAEKKIQFLLEQIRSRYRIETNHIDADFIHTLSIKSGKELHDLRKLFDLIQKIKQSEKISSNTLLELNSQTETFYK